MSRRASSRGRLPCPSVVILDSRSVKTTGRGGSRGFDGNKRVKGRKREVRRTFELCGRRRKGKALAFIIDEVGQHVARSSDKIEDLRVTIEEFGKVGKNLLKERKIIAPCWIVVTSQEKLEEVVAAIDSKRVELAKLQDRFRYRVDLAPSDIREVATKRCFGKENRSREAAKEVLL